MPNSIRPAYIGGKKNIPLRKHLYEQRYLLLMILPCIIWIIIFCYIPMGGIVMAFQNYRPASGIFGSEWVGLKWFRQMAGSSQMMNILRNTVCISLIKLVFGFPIPIIFALLVNEVSNKRYLRTVQTISYLPHFLSWVITIGIFQQILSIDGGIFNVVKEKLFGFPPKNYFGDPTWVWPLAYITEVWKEVGWSAIIYIAALSGIDPSMHEAAIIDGAGKMQRIIHINLPGIRATIIILLILASGNVLNSNFDQLYLMRKDAVMRTVEVIDTYVYSRVMVDPTSYSYGTAVTLFKSVINVFFLLIVNFISLKVSEESLF